MFISRCKQWCMVLHLDWFNWYLMLNFARSEGILKNDSCKTSHKWFILSTFHAQHTITCKLSRSTFKIRGGCAKIHLHCVYKFQAHLAFLTVARTCKYEFPVFARFQLCNALSHGNTKSAEYRTTWRRLQIRSSKVFTVEWIEVALPLSRE